MEDILELQRQLAEAQQASSSKKLSDRNCVELVMKLQSLNLIDVIFTRSGREYLTHHQLTKEIEEQIADREGTLYALFGTRSVAKDDCDMHLTLFSFRQAALTLWSYLKL